MCSSPPRGRYIIPRECTLCGRRCSSEQRAHTLRANSFFMMMIYFIIIIINQWSELSQFYVVVLGSVIYIIHYRPSSVSKMAETRLLKSWVLSKHPQPSVWSSGKPGDAGAQLKLRWAGCQVFESSPWRINRVLELVSLALYKQGLVGIPYHMNLSHESTLRDIVAGDVVRKSAHSERTPFLFIYLLIWWWVMVLFFFFVILFFKSVKCAVLTQF